MSSPRIIELGAADFVLTLDGAAGQRGLAAVASKTPQPGAIENARFDLRCRELGVSQHVLLGGAIRSAVPIVAAVTSGDLDQALRLLDALHARALSLHLPVDAEVTATVDRFARRLGKDIALRLCLHGTADTGSVARALRGVTLECCYVEAGMLPLDLGVTPVGLLATNGSIAGLRDLAPRAAINSVLTDARTLSGPTALETVHAVAQVFQLEVALAAPIGSPLDVLANGHAAASGFAMHGGVELARVPDFAPYGWAANDILRDGMIVLPDAPGLGLELKR
jgi:L-alanine-DL-glutamate epimerase-like enolase superfamily enzyme